MFSRSICAKFRGETLRKFAVFLREFLRSFSAKSRGEKKWSARTYAKSCGVFSAKVRVWEFLIAEWTRKKELFLGLICILALRPPWSCDLENLNKHFFFLSEGSSTWNLASFGLVVSKEKKFENIESEWPWTNVNEWPWPLIFIQVHIII